jgi:hypothetical protein
MNPRGRHYLYALRPVAGEWWCTCSCGRQDVGHDPLTLQYRWMVHISGHPSLP